MQIDPRTVAREIPGVLDEVFPQLTPSIVAYFNSSAHTFAIRPIPPDALTQSRLQRAMLFELGYTVGEHLLKGLTPLDWHACFQETERRQRVYFDAKIPQQLEPSDKATAEIVGSNLFRILSSMGNENRHPLVIAPQIPGLEWIGNGYGDFSLGRNLIEVKCTAKKFSAADYRQVAIYWILSYAAAVEGRGEEWESFCLLNPRSGQMVSMKFDYFLNILSSGRTKVDTLKLFQSIISSRLTR
ncbi:hypothetical protein [Bordetella trematum]|uniref:hypothetical protein n=1 Tax=Bordetella trematum TaxID=123899 RepID=UPI0009DBB9CA|nr:hypothetical protein [Bordetella trematum]